jgi:hypothetical protein
MESGARPGDNPHALLRQLAGPGDEVGMHVRFDGRHDRRAKLFCGVDVDRRIAPRVDHDRLLRAIAADEKRRLREPVVEETLEHAIESAAVPPAEIIHLQ